MIRVGVQQGLQCCTNQNPSDLAAALCRILLEISLLDSAYMRSGASDDLNRETLRSLPYIPQQRSPAREIQEASALSTTLSNSLF